MLTSAIVSFVSCLDACLDAVGVRPPLDHGITKQRYATASLTAPETNAGIRTCISPDEALGGSTSTKHPSDIICQKSDWLTLPIGHHSPVLPYGSASCRLANKFRSNKGAVKVDHGTRIKN
jgi:hypothetical protein